MGMCLCPRHVTQLRYQITNHFYFDTSEHVFCDKGYKQIAYFYTLMGVHFNSLNLKRFHKLGGGQLKQIKDGMLAMY